MLQAYKSSCSKQLIICDLEDPRPLPKHFLPVVKKVSTNATEWCSAISFKMDGKNATNIELNIVSCAENFLMMCEVIENK